MSNTLLTDQVIANESLRLLKNNLVFARGVSRKFEKEWDTEKAIGDTINVKLPAQYTSRTGAAISVQDHTQKSVPVQLTTQRGIDVAFTSKELTLNLKDFSKNVLQPQIVQLANDIDYDGLVMAYQAVANAVGTPGTIPNAIKTYATAGAYMDNAGCPQDDQRSVLLNPLAQVEIIDSLKGLFNSSSEVKQQYERGRMGQAAGFDWSMSQNIPLHTVGALGGTPLVNGASQSGSSLVTDGWTASANPRLKKGDVFTIANVYGVNPLNKQSTGQLKQFVVTADVSSDGSGNLTAAISPAIVTSGPYQNVNAGPADNAAITVLGAAGTQSPQHLAYHKDAFTLVTAELPLPGGMDMAARSSAKDVGLAIRFIRGYDINTDKFVSRLDVLYGWAPLRSEWACRIMG